MKTGFFDPLTFDREFNLRFFFYIKFVHCALCTSLEKDGLPYDNSWKSFKNGYNANADKFKI